MPSRANLAIYQGDDYGALVTVSDGTATPPDLSGYTAQAQIRLGPADSNVDVVAEFATAINANTVALSLPAAKTVELSGMYSWDLQLVRSDGIVTTILAGSAVATAEITRQGTRRAGRPGRAAGVQFYDGGHTTMAAPVTQQFTATLVPAGPEGPQGPQGPPGPSSTLGFGRVLADGTVYTNSGWTCSHTVTGTYVLTHNLNKDPRTYVVLVCPGDNTPGRAAPQASLVLVVTQQALNSFTVQAIDGSNMNPIDGAFNFGVFQ